MNYSLKTTCCQSPSWDCAIMDLCHINYLKRLLVCCFHLGASLLFILLFVCYLWSHQVLVSYLVSSLRLCTQGNSVSTKRFLCRHRKYSRCVSHSIVIRRHCVDTEKLLCTQENCVLTQKIRTHLLKLILCRPLNSKWETLCRHRKSLEIVV